MLRVDDQAFRTDTGRQRSANEDSLFVRAPIFVVADGMGGAQAGEVASKAAAEAFDRDLPDDPPERFLRETIEAANREIHELARADPSRAGMGTTITAAIVDAENEEVGIGHVGDSRAYRLRGGKLERLTRDHSLVEEMRRKGQITDAQAEDHPQRSIITRALGPEPEVEVDVQTVPAAPGDVFLLCSDGLTTMVGEERIAAVLAGAGSMREAVRALVDEANGAGGRDNITALAFRLDDAAAPPARPPRDATLVGAAAEEAGLTATEVRRRAAAAAAQERRDAARRRSRAAAACVPPPRSWPSSSCSAAVAFGAWYGNRQVWFLGTDDGGRVALYRGLPYELPFGIDALPGALREPDPDRGAAAQAPRSGHRPRPALALGRRLADRRHRTQPGGSLRSVASQEPGARSPWFPVALLLTAGFAAVFAQENARLGNLSLVYGAYFLAICLATHVYLRIRLPERRPLPLPAGRAADRLRPGDDLPDRRRPGPRPGQLVRPRPRPLRPDDPVPARLRRARALPLHDRRGRAAAAAGAAPAGDRPAGQRRLPRGEDRPARLPAGRVLEDLHRRLPRQLPARAPRGADRRRPAGARRDPAAAQAPRPAAGRLGRVDVHARLHPRPRQLADVLRRLPRPALRGDRPLLLRRDRHGDVPGRRLVLRLDRPPRPRPGRDLARSLPGPHRRAATRSSSRSSPRPTAASSARASARR